MDAYEGDTLWLGEGGLLVNGVYGKLEKARSGLAHC